jgi:cold-inducible RNA-binding protein
MKKIFVGGLPFRYEDKDLGDLFAPFGEVKSASIIRDRMMNNRSKGFGFVEMEDAEADKAISGLNGSELDGRTLTVNEARPMTERPPRSSNGGGFGNRGRSGGYSNGGGYNRDNRDGGRDRYNSRDGGRDRDSY